MNFGRPLPKGWAVFKLEEVCQHITVGHVGPMADQYLPQGIPFLRSQNILPFRLALDDVKFISAGFHAKLKKSSLAPGDVVIVRTGYPGTACVIPQFMTVANCADLVIARPSDKLNPWFLAALLNSAWGRGSVAGNLVGVAQQHFNVSAAKAMKVALPARQVQDRIASILSAYDELIENNTRRIAILEEMARRIYEEWFARFRFPGHEGVRMTESELGLVPEGWQVVPLGQLAKVNNRSVRRGAEPTEIQYVDISSVSTGSIDHKERMLFADAPGRARRFVQDGDVIWACVRPNRKSYALVVNPEPNLLVSTGFAVLSPVAVPSSFIYQCVTTDDFVSHLVNHAKGAAYPAVGAEDFESAKVLKPARDLVEAFDRIADPMLRLVSVLQVSNATLRRTRDLLLPKLISAELDVSALYEPEALAA
jgi:type I restriction enzyme, S subunit